MGDRQNTTPNNVSPQNRLMLVFLMQILDIYYVTDALTMVNNRNFGSNKVVSLLILLFHHNNGPRHKWVLPQQPCSRPTGWQYMISASHMFLPQTWSVPEQAQALSHHLRHRVLYSPENCLSKCSIQYTKHLSCLSHKKAPSCSMLCSGFRSIRRFNTQSSVFQRDVDHVMAFSSPATAPVP